MFESESKVAERPTGAHPSLWNPDLAATDAAARQWDWRAIAVGSDADIIVWDPEKERTILKDTHHQNIDFNIFEGMTVKGINVVTLSRGRITWQNGDVRAERGTGKYIPRSTFPPYYAALQELHERKAPKPVKRA